MAIDRSTNVSLVAFYGDKPVAFHNLLERLQTYLVNHQLLQDKFIPYQLAQVHGTIIGCEGFKTDSGVVNRWFEEKRGETKQINFSGLIDRLQQQIDLPTTIRFGGYHQSVDYNFLSRDRHLYHRSFQLQSLENQTVPVLIGWSWQDNAVTLAIDKLRRSLQQFNLLHKYHATPEAVDNDFYLRLGTIATRLSVAEIDLISTDVRNLLAVPLSVSVGLNDLAFVQYQDLQLTPATTKVIPASSITASQLEQLYVGR